MKAKSFLFASLLLLSILFIPQRSYAQEASGSSASFSSLLIERGADNRCAILKAYLNQFSSPLAEHACIFVEQADLYQLDWRFVAAISGRESTFGKAEPCINPFGFGIYGDQTMCFPSYDEAIKTVSKTIREQYMNQWGAQTIWEVGHMYASSPTWASGVISIMNDIQTYANNQEASTLPISL